MPDDISNNAPPDQAGDSPSTAGDWHRIVSGHGVVVVKIGSSLLIDDKGEARSDWMASVASRLAHRPGPVVIVSSGAIALGRRELGLDNRPRQLAEAQAAAAIGQIRLARLWSDTWARFDRTAAQVLLTLGDLEQRKRYLNARDTLETLLLKGVVAIINENDTVATSEIRFGDNDRLAARVAQLVSAEQLVLLSDVDGLYERNPLDDPHARHIPLVEAITPAIEALAGDAESTGFGTGGMRSKLEAARIAMAAGIPVLLTNGSAIDPLAANGGNRRATRFSPPRRGLQHRKRWLGGLQNRCGQLTVDDGARRALAGGASLLAVGIRELQGDFKRGDLVSLATSEGVFGQGLVAYDYREVGRIAGLPSEEIAEALGASGRGPVVHRDDLVIF